MSDKPDSKKSDASNDSDMPVLTEEEKEFIERLKKQIEDSGENSSYMIAGMSKRIP